MISIAGTADLERPKIGAFLGPFGPSLAFFWDSLRYDGVSSLLVETPLRCGVALLQPLASSLVWTRKSFLGQTPLRRDDDVESR